MSIFPVLPHQDERTDEGGGHQGGLWPQDLQTGGQAELGKEEEARVDGNNWPDSLCERAHRRKSREGTWGGEKGWGSSRRSLPRAEGGSTGTRPSQGEHRAQEATSDVGWQVSPLSVGRGTWPSKSFVPFKVRWSFAPNLKLCIVKIMYLGQELTTFPVYDNLQLIVYFPFSSFSIKKTQVCLWYFFTRAPLLYFIRGWIALSFKVFESVRHQ